jgi:glutathione S-transferase
MGFIKLNRFGDPNGCVFDAAAVAEKLRRTFPHLRLLPGDPLALSAERAAASGAPEHVVATLRRNQREYGPACGFEIGIEGRETIQGRVRRYDVSFLFADPLTEEWRQRLLDFLRGLGVGRIEEAADKAILNK